MFYEEYPPGDGLRQYIASYWKFVAPPGDYPPIQHTAPPDGCVSLLLYTNPIYHLRQSILLGPSIGVVQSTLLPGSVYVGARFMPGAFSCFFDYPSESLRDRHILLGNEAHFSDIFDRLDADFENLDSIGKVLLQFKNGEPDVEVGKAVRLLVESEGNLRIAEIIRQAFIGERQLQRRFRQEVGLSMKEFARVRRMRAAMVRLVLHRQTTLDASLNSGYYDQAHFLHDFQSFARMKPSELENYLRQIEHGAIHW
jgi:AraC-like DNA-binding protein